MAEPRVVVLMSTYNGERYVAEQLRSILAQLPLSSRVQIRDDGSSDNTVAAIQALGDPRVTVDAGANVGFGASFLTLLSRVDPDTELVLFCDQDDVWLPEKVERARAALAPLAAGPALYASAQLLVDAELRVLHATPRWPQPPSFAGALTENIVTGCTAALNNAALRLLQRAGVPAGVHFHDWWLYVVISAFGTVIHDDEPTLMYRQHGANQIGHGAGWWGRQRQIVRFLLRNDWVGILLAQVGALQRHYGSALAPAERALVQAYFTACGDDTRPRWRLVFSTRRWRHTGFGEVALRVLLAAWLLRLWPPPGLRLRQPAGRRTGFP